MTDARDPHDPALDAAWRHHVRDEPPRALDDAILAAGHRAVQSAPQAAAPPAARWRAWAPLAVAATLGAIAFGVVQLAPHEPDATRAVVADAPVATPQKPAQPARNAPALASREADAASAATAAPSTAAPSTAAPSAAAPGTFAAPRPGTLATPAAASAPPPPAAEAHPGPKLQAPPRGATALSGAPDRAAVSARSSSAIDERERGAAAPPDALAKREGALDERKDAANAAPAPQPFPAAPPLERAREPAAVAERRVEQPTAPRRQEFFAQKQAAQSAGGAIGRAAELPGAGSGGKAGADAAPAPAARSAPAAAPAEPVDRLTTQESASVMARDAATTNEVRAKVATTRSPDDYVRDIRRLRGEGRDADAALALAAFRVAYPDADARLPEDLRGWARGVARP